MKRSNRWNSVVVLVTVLMTIAILSAVYALGKGDKAPGFKLQNLSGKTMSLDELRKDPAKKGVTRPVMLVFWATWCPHCVNETKVLQELNSKYSSKGFEIVGISLDSGGAKDVAPFVKERKLSYTILLDPDNKVGGPLYGVRGLPTSFILDKNGIIRYSYIGEYPGMEKTLDRDINSVLK